MNILYIIPSMEKCGPINVCLSLVKSLSENNNISILCFKTGNLKSEFQYYCKDIKIIPIKNILKIVNYINYKEFDVIHSHCLLPDVVLSFASRIKWRNRKYKTLSTIHNYIDYDYIYSKGVFYGYLMGVVNRFSIKYFDRLICCSESVSLYCKEKYGIDSFYVRNGVDDVFPYNENHEINDKNTFDFYYLGVLNKRKNIDFLLSSFKKYNEKFNDRLHIIGGGPLLIDLKSIYESNNINFYGNSIYPHEITSSLDVYISMSNAEGLPLAMIEAIGQGKPYIVSDIEPHVEIHNIVNAGTVTALNDEEALISALTKVREWELNNLSKKARNSFLNNFNSVLMAEKYLINYREIL